ncbi:MAG: glutamate--tRNA ligase [Patescibacteria group bacterium]|nr:glutamate--tRNA ligase [Patescibacteria group bacterium]
MVRTRFAPSPTGYIHIGSIRTALYSYAYAKKHGGTFILRIEDTDKKREMEGGVEDIVKALKVFGLDFDEGPSTPLRKLPGNGGPYSPYIQSQRLDIYKGKAEELVENRKAYYCFCSEERLLELREKQQKEGKKPMYDRKCRDLDIQESRKKIADGEKYVVRLNVPSGRKLGIDDKVMGKVSWDSDEVDDQVLLKSDGFPTYHLAVVVDDVIMGVTHITRGIEWLASVPKHILLFEAFGYKMPVMAHMPVILDPAGGKLSKRKGTVSVEDFLKQGYLSEALLNFLMLLGWAPDDDREFFSLKEFVKVFSLERLNRASPVFDRLKLLWFNGEYIRKYSTKDFAKKVLDWTREYCDDEKMKKAILEDTDLTAKLELIQERIVLLSEAVTSLQFFYERMPVPDTKTVKGIKRYEVSNLKKAVVDYAEVISRYDDATSQWTHEDWEKNIRELADKYKIKHGDMFMMIRLVICGSPISPPLYESLVILGKQEVLERLENFR